MIFMTFDVVPTLCGKAKGLGQLLQKTNLWMRMRRRDLPTVQEEQKWSQSLQCRLAATAHQNLFICASFVHGKPGQIMTW